MTASNGLSSQDFNQRVAECLAAMNANYEELVEYLEGINHDGTQIAWDQSHIDAKTKVRDTHHEVGPGGKTVTVYTYRTVNKYSATQIAQWQEDMSSREQDKSKLSALFNQASGDLQRLASTLGVLFMTGNASVGSEAASSGSAADLQEVMQNLELLFKQIQDQEWQNSEMSFLLSMQLAARDETKRGKAEASAPKMELPASTLSSSVHKNEVRQERSDGSKAPSRSNPEFAKGIEQLSSKEQVQAIQKDLLPIFLAIETKSSDWQVQVDPISREILQKPQYTVEDKQRAFLSLFLLVQKGNLSQMSNGGSPVVQSVSDRGVLSNDAKANGQTVAPIAISEEAHASVQKTAFTPFAKDETDRFPIDVSVKRETEAFVFVASSPETTSLLLPYIPVIDRAIEQAASTVVQHLAPQTKGALQQLPLFSAAKHAIRSIVEPVVFKAVQEQAKQKESPIVVGQVQATLQPSQKEDFTSLVEQVATRSAEQTAVVLIGAGLALTRSQDETTSIAKGKTVEEGSLPTTATSLSNNPSFFATKPVVEQKTESVQVAPQSVQGMLSLADQVIGSGTYSQLAVEGAFSTVVRSAGILQQLLTVKSFAETDLLTDAIPEIGTGRSGTNSINPLASEVVKEQKQTIGTGDSESAQTAEEEPRVAPNSYHQILAV